MPTLALMQRWLLGGRAFFAEEIFEVVLRVERVEVVGDVCGEVVDGVECVGGFSYLFEFEQSQLQASAAAQVEVGEDDKERDEAPQQAGASENAGDQVPPQKGIAPPHFECRQGVPGGVGNRAFKGVPGNDR